MIYSLFVVIHVVVCFLMVIGILMQTGKSGGFQGIFGSSGEVIFSTPSGASFLRKVTIGLAAAFGITSLVLTVQTKRRMYRSVLEQVPVSAPTQTPPPAQAVPPAGKVQTPSKQDVVTPPPANPKPVVAPSEKIPSPKSDSESQKK